MNPSPSAPRVARCFLDRRANTTCDIVSGPARKQYADAVWAMYVKTYSGIGMGVHSANELLQEFATWQMCIGKDGLPYAFLMFKPTAFGQKFSLAGSDGSPEGKHLIVKTIQTSFKTNGNYAEVSHKIQDIALAAGAPVVCALYAEKVLNKDVDPQPDGVSYKRVITGFGPAVKVMVGKPKGVPTTAWEHPSCPVEHAVTASERDEDDSGDTHAHLACLAFGLD